MDVISWLLMAALAAGCTLAERPLLHDYQLENYQFAGYFRTVRRTWKRALLPGLAMAAAVLLALLDAAVIPLKWLAAVLFALITLGVGFWLFTLSRREKSKKRFTITARVKRLHVVQGLTHLGLLALVCLIAGAAPSAENLLAGSTLCIVLLCVYCLLLPLWVFVAAFLCWPMELFIRALYARDAKRILRGRPDLIRIGITGSYGKTSVKFILTTLLREKYQVCASPSSVNTPMGLARVIRGDLKPAHQVFIAEMGARHRHDIRDLTRLVKPQLGLLTSVGPQHLETFHTLANIRETKYDLIRAIPAEGCAFFNGDDAICRELYAHTAGKPKRMSSIAAREEADVWADQVQVTETGSHFRLYTRTGSIDCETRLLGEHNIRNILLAASVAQELGLTLEEIRRGIAKLRPVQHRLQLLPGNGGITVIDDAFNSNPVGTMAALEVIRQFAGRRLVMTPGMVELGASEAQFNREFGERMAEAADTVILIGAKHTAPIREGLLSKGFAEDEIHTVSSLSEGQALLARLARPGDTVLLENDLPDNYTE